MSKDTEYNVTEEDVRERLQKMKSDSVDKYKKKISLTKYQKEKLSRSMAVYAKKLMQSGIPEEQAKEMAKAKFDILKKRIQPMQTQEKDEAINAFLSELKTA